MRPVDVYLRFGESEPFFGGVLFDGDGEGVVVFGEDEALAAHGGGVGEHGAVGEGEFLEEFLFGFSLVVVVGFVVVGVFVGVFVWGFGFVVIFGGGGGGEHFVGRGIESVEYFFAEFYEFRDDAVVRFG